MAAKAKVMDGFDSFDSISGSLSSHPSQTFVAMTARLLFAASARPPPPHHARAIDFYFPLPSFHTRYTHTLEPTHRVTQPISSSLVLTQQQLLLLNHSYPARQLLFQA
jgi:hypothetical protein